MPDLLRIHVLQHVPFEGPAAIADWIHQRGHPLAVTRLYQEESLPVVEDFDWLIVMGGPMGVSDTQQYPWLQQERALISEAVNAKKCVLGICLGAQLIAAALGASVKKNLYREIGWFDIHRSEEVAGTLFDEIWPGSLNVFHWHGDTFDIPSGAHRLASSEACINQGYILDNHVVGLQFHIEVTPDSVATLVENCRDELEGSRYVQSEAALMKNGSAFAEIHALLFACLQVMENATN